MDDISKAISKMLTKAISDFAEGLSREFSKQTQPMEISDQSAPFADALQYAKPQPDPMSSEAYSDAVQFQEPPLVQQTAEAFLPEPEGENQVESSVQSFQTQPMETGGFTPQDFQVDAELDKPSPIPELSVREVERIASTPYMEQRDFSTGDFDGLANFVDESSGFEKADRQTVANIIDCQQEAHKWGRAMNDRHFQMMQRMSMDMSNDYWRIDGLVNAYERGRNTITDTNV